jgi:ankyrin repeat protein
MEELNDVMFGNNLERIQQLLSTLHLSQKDLYWVLWSYINSSGPVWTVNINCFKAVLQYVDVNFNPEIGQRHLPHAALGNNIELVRLLLEHGATPILSDSERTILQNKGYTEVINLIDNYEVDIKEPVS